MKSQISPKSWNLVAGIVFPVITFFLSAPLVGHAVYLFIMRNHHSYDFRTTTLVSISLLAVFLASNAALFVRPRRLSFPMQLLLIVFFIGLAYAGVNEMQNRRPFPPKPKWLMGENSYEQRKFEKYQVVHVEQSQGRLQRVRLRFDGSFNFTAWYRWRSPYIKIKTGCCMRPGKCELEKVNATIRVAREREGPPLETVVIYGRYGGNADIKDYYDMWRNELSVMYYDCMTCEVRIIKSPRLRKWWQLGIFFSSLTPLLD